MKTEHIAIGKVKPNKDNPRIIKDDKFKKLVNSIKSFPEMLQLRPIVVNDKMVVLGGNMRLKACKEAGLKKVYIIKAEDLTEEQQKEFIIKDNVSFGEHDWSKIANEWDETKLDEWGLDVWQPEEDEQKDITASLETFKLTIKCDDQKELDELQSKLDVSKDKINYKEFLLKTAL